MAENVRTERLASSIQRLLQEAIARGLNDPRVRGLVTVTRIEMVDEGRTARAYISVLPADRAELTMHGLRDAAGHLRRVVMSRIRVKHMPRLEIHYDEQLKRQSEVLKAISRVEQERLAKAPEQEQPDQELPDHELPEQELPQQEQGELRTGDTLGRPGGDGA